MKWPNLVKYALFLEYENSQNYVGFFIPKNIENIKAFY